MESRRGSSYRFVNFVVKGKDVLGRVDGSCRCHGCRAMERAPWRMWNAGGLAVVEKGWCGRNGNVMPRFTYDYVVVNAWRTCYLEKKERNEMLPGQLTEVRACASFTCRVASDALV
ncbi:hypothetical protein NDU88_000764 [Pleurodeles waltl]|uniref:Uncharacterized protein n=1 Tax=Pleurodeles waltl TaxID=8319 RepID=A0AAV7UQY1_PLEWA|nr:hypothetical protein NDU88_000764 [Pleurodeles waltl]